ncbi:exosortase E/protease, VPEID-CTERM system [Planctomicrobium piriforme]|uniref:Exosortase E/protease, VPEID-CTERM system n=1 Tax=Planctomicrobium piriforme TaxID=1576369 RepID=A0A1I3JVH7_9PLAN|nr:exosortase E/protease, VPEID-CTERM system [Planctomicrobium piriforme]SFI64184.1 exosortase E/protease, VPEID-CTERM system [Planctomicrobium piriforme]
MSTHTPELTLESAACGSSSVPAGANSAVSNWTFALRAGCLSAVLLVELLCLTVRFDSKTLASSADGFLSIMQFAPRLPQVLIAMLAALCLTGRVRLQHHYRTFANSDLQDHAWQWWGLAQLAIFAGFWLATSLLYESQALPTSAQLPVTALWLTLGAGTVLTWLRSIAPWQCWGQFLLAEKRALVIGAVVGCASLGLGSMAQGLWEPMAAGTLWNVTLLLRCLYPEVIVDASQRIVGTPAFRVEIAPQCSGYEGIGLVVAFLAAFCLLFRSRLRYPHAWLLWPIGILAAWVGNSVRIAALIAIGSSISPAVAMGGFHSQAGWIFFNGVALTLAAVAMRVPFFSNQAVPFARSAVATRSPVAAYLGPFLVLMAANVLTAAFTTAFDWSYPAKVVVTALAIGALAPRFVAVRPSLRTTPISVLVHYRDAITCGVLVFIVWMLTAPVPAGSSEMPNALTGSLTAVSVTWVLFRIVGSVITVPIVEELAFRGYLMRRMASERFEQLAYRSVPVWSIMFSSLLFGLMHQRWIAGAMAGVAYAYAARRRNSLYDAIIAHAVTNGLIAATVLLGDAWWLW